MHFVGVQQPKGSTLCCLFFIQVTQVQHPGHKHQGDEHGGVQQRQLVSRVQTPGEHL